LEPFCWGFDWCVVLVLLPLLSYGQKKEIEKQKDSIKQLKQELFYEFRYYNTTPCYCPTTIELLEKLNDRKKQFTNPYKFAEKDTLKIAKKEIFI